MNTEFLFVRDVDHTKLISLFFLPQVQPNDELRCDISHEPSSHDQQRPGMVHLCVQPPRRLRGRSPVAAVWTLRSRH